MPITTNKIEVRIDFHIYDIIDFDLLLGYPLEKLLASHGSLDEMLREKCFCHCYSLLRKSFGKAASRAKPPRGDDAYISIHIIQARSLGSSRIP